jgi:hypothetical protein
MPWTVDSLINDVITIKKLAMVLVLLVVVVT